MRRHVSSEALFRGFHASRFGLRFFFRRFRCFRGGFLRFFFSGRFRADCPVDRLQRRVGGHRRAAQRFDAVLAVSEGAALADELVGKRRLGGAFAQAFGFAGRIDRQRFDLVPVQGDMRRHVPGEALFRSFSERGGFSVRCSGIIDQLFAAAEHACHRQDDHTHKHGADRDPDPLFLRKIIHSLPSLLFTRGWS